VPPHRRATRPPRCPVRTIVADCPGGTTRRPRIRVPHPAGAQASRGPDRIVSWVALSSLRPAAPTEVLGMVTVVEGLKLSGVTGAV
jgi:hypothetical protein